MSGAPNRKAFVVAESKEKSSLNYYQHVAHSHYQVHVKELNSPKATKYHTKHYYESVYKNNALLTRIESIHFNLQCLQLLY